jgi:hypothetical protein
VTDQQDPDQFADRLLAGDLRQEQSINRTGPVDREASQQSARASEAASPID